MLFTRCPPTAGVLCQGICTDSPEPHANNLGNCIESDHDSASSPTDSSMDKSTNSKALVAVPAMKVEALAVVPAHQKSKQSEIVQRRIRRPFSVAEVEALVQAVEKLGTGRYDWINNVSLGLVRSLIKMLSQSSHLYVHASLEHDFLSCITILYKMKILMFLLICRWRDVKLRAFDNAKHRTYVDLKVGFIFSP